MCRYTNNAVNSGQGHKSLKFVSRSMPRNLCSKKWVLTLSVRNILSVYQSTKSTYLFRERDKWQKSKINKCLKFKPITAKVDHDYLQSLLQFMDRYGLLKACLPYIYLVGIIYLGLGSLLMLSQHDSAYLHLKVKFGEMR